MDSKKIKVRSFDLNGGQVYVGVITEAEGEIFLNFVDFYNLVKTLNLEYGTEIKVISPKTADLILNDAKQWTLLPTEFGFFTDSIVGYEKPGVELGNEIIFPSIYESEKFGVVLGVPKKYQGRKDVALVALNLSADNFKVEGKNIIVHVEENKLIVIEDFPARDRFCMAHETTIPHGKEVESGSDTNWAVKTSLESRYLLRSLTRAYVGPIVRYMETDSYGGYGNVTINLDGIGGPNRKSPAVVEISTDDFEKIKARGGIFVES